MSSAGVVDTSSLTPLLRAADVAMLLGTSPQHVLALARAGVLPRVAIGRRIRFRSEEVRLFVERGGATAPSQAPSAPDLNQGSPISRRGRPRIHCGGIT
jgi:excisionase family DNA binding protein